MATVLISKSMGLVADSIDMLSDSLVCAISLIAVGELLLKKADCKARWIFSNNTSNYWFY
jgi:Co/Zn/Cd efflux system component